MSSSSVIAAAAGAGAGARRAAASAACSRRESFSYPTSTGGGTKAGGAAAVLHLTLDHETAMQLAALYRAPHKRDSADTLGYKVRPTSPSMGGASDPCHPRAAPGGTGGRASHAGAAAAGLITANPGFAFAKEAFLGRAARAGAVSQEGRWVERVMGGARPVAAEDVDAAMARLEAALLQNGVPVQFHRCVKFRCLVSARGNFAGGMHMVVLLSCLKIQLDFDQYTIIIPHTTHTGWRPSPTRPAASASPSKRSTGSCWSARAAATRTC